MTKKTLPETPVLNTERLRLKPIGLSDADAVLSMLSDAETVRYWGNDEISELSQAETIIHENLDWVSKGDCLYWAIELVASGETIGTCMLFKFDKQNRRAEIGYMLNRGFWRQGLMSEAVTRMIEFAFNTLDLHRLEADTDPRNAASNGLLEKFGFKHEGYFRERWLVHGYWHDSDMWGLLKADYPPA